MIESFSTLPIQSIIPSYLYQQYSDDDDLQAFVDAYNAIAQGYLDWFIANPLGLYTAPQINGPLLDWIANGIYDLYRPVLASQVSQETAGYDDSVYNGSIYNALTYSEAGSTIQTTDDIFKRTMTWNLYRGDGQIFCVSWLKNRVARFIHGANGSDCNVLNFQPSVTSSKGSFTIHEFGGANYTAMTLCYQSGFLAFPFQYTLNFSPVNFANSSGVLTLPMALYYPQSTAGLAAGSIWYNNGTVSVVSGVTPNPDAPPLFFATIDPNTLLSTGGGNLPTTNPNVNGQLWNNAGVVTIAT